MVDWSALEFLRLIPRLNNLLEKYLALGQLALNFLELVVFSDARVRLNFLLNTLFDDYVCGCPFQIAVRSRQRSIINILSIHALLLTHHFSLEGKRRQ